MTTKNACWSCLRLFVLIAVALVVMLAVKKARADEPEMTVVHVLATDAWAPEFLEHSCFFTVYRNGPTNEQFLNISLASGNFAPAATHEPSGEQATPPLSPV